MLWIRNDLVRLNQGPAVQVFSDPVLPYSLNQAQLNYWQSLNAHNESAARISSI